MREEHFDKEWGEPFSLIQTEREKAFASLTTLLVEEQKAVGDWLEGVAGDRAFHNPHTGARKYFVHAALRDLIAWLRGTMSAADLKPFKMTRPDGASVRVPLSEWQQRPLEIIPDP